MVTPHPLWLQEHCSFRNRKTTSHFISLRDAEQMNHHSNHTRNDFHDAHSQSQFPSPWWPLRVLSTRGSNAKKWPENLCGNAEGAVAGGDLSKGSLASRRKRVERTINVRSLNSLGCVTKQHNSCVCECECERATPKLPGAHIVSTWWGVFLCLGRPASSVHGHPRALYACGGAQSVSSCVCVRACTYSSCISLTFELFICIWASERAAALTSLRSQLAACPCELERQ